MNGNSFTEKREAEKAEESKIVPIIKHPPKSKVKITRKIVGLLFDETGIPLIDDTIKPGIVDLLYDIGMAGLISVFYPDDRVPSRRRKSGGSSFERTDYQARSNGRPSQSRPSQTRRGVLDVEEGFDDPYDAYTVRDYIVDRITNYPACTIADYYDVMGKTYSGGAVATEWGWDSDDIDAIKSLKAKKHRDGLWYIEMPKPKHLD